MLSRTIRVARQSSRLLSTTRVLKSGNHDVYAKTATDLAQVTGPDGTLIGPGAKPGTIPTDQDQSTGLQRFELLGKEEGIDVFDMENPIYEGSGTMADPYLVPSYVGYRYVGTRKPDEDKVYWLKVEYGQPARSWHTGTVFAIKYLGEPGQHHH